MLKIEVSNKIELHIGEYVVVMTKVEVRSLIRQLQEDIRFSDSPKFTGTLTYPPGTREYTLNEHNIPCDTKTQSDVNLERYWQQVDRNSFIRDTVLSSQGY